MFINGTLTNNGTISMTARGANAEGRFVSIDCDVLSTDNDFEAPNIRWDLNNTKKSYFVQIGKTTGAPTNSTAINGYTYNCCGSGGGGGHWKNAITLGGNGTSFSGGTGGGGGCGVNGKNGSSNGGAGGAGNASAYRTSGGGAGNPGGLGMGHWNAVNINEAQAGASGTGGLIIIIANKIINNGVIESNGSNGGKAAIKGTLGDSGNSGGGGSGAGSIFLFHREGWSGTGTIRVVGGYGGTAVLPQARYPGKNGGNGSIQIIQCPDIVEYKYYG